MQFFLQAMWNNTAISTFELHVTLFFYFEKHYLANNSLFSRLPKEINFTTQKEDSDCFLDKKQGDCFSAIYSIVNSCNLKQSERPTVFWCIGRKLQHSFIRWSQNYSFKTGKPVLKISPKVKCKHVKLYCLYFFFFLHYSVFLSFFYRCLSVTIV